MLYLPNNLFLFHLDCLLGAWIYGSIWILPPLFGWNRFILEGFGTSCTFDYVSKDVWDRTFILVLIIGGFLIPLLVIAMSYALILLKLSQRSRRLILQNTEETSPTQLTTAYYFNQLNPYPERQRGGTTTAVEFAIDDNSMIRNIRRTEARATRTALYIFLIFCVAWGPYTLAALLSVFGFDRCVNAYSTAILGLSTKLAACINPLIYALSLSGFREQICSYLKCLMCCEDVQQIQLIQTASDSHRRKLPNLSNGSNSRPLDAENRFHV